MVKPYEQKWHNLVDVLLLADLALISGLTIYNYYYSTQANVRTDYRRIDASASIQIILIYLPLLCYVVGYTGYRVWEKWGKETLWIPREDEKVVGRPRMRSTSSVIDLQDLQNQDDDPFSDEPLPQISISDHKSTSGMSTNSPSCHKISDDLTTNSPLPQHVSEPPQTSDSDHELPIPSSNPISHATTVVKCGKDTCSPSPCKTSNDLTTNGPLPQPANESPKTSDSDHELTISSTISPVVNCVNDSSLETPTDGHPFPDISTNCLPSVTPNNSSPSHETTEILTNDPSPPELSDPTNSSQNL